VLRNTEQELGDIEWSHPYPTDSRLLRASSNTQKREVCAFYFNFFSLLQKRTDAFCLRSLFNIKVCYLG
jgi:hypothetical protein